MQQASDFLQWIPLLEHPGSAVIYRPGDRPVLVVHRSRDYWHQPPALPASPFVEEFDVRVIESTAELPDHLPRHGAGLALLGPPDQWSGIAMQAMRNPEPLLNALHFHRAWKTPWEVACIRDATRRAAPGHHAAEAAFRSGANEYEILGAFLTGCGQLEPELPYAAIVALNQNGATLHYQHRNRERRAAAELHSLLIDAGCSMHGYACDITRTYSFRDAEFAGMIADLDEVQRRLCAAARPGTAFPDLHRAAHRCVAELLAQWGLVQLSPEAMMENGVTACFFPHGLGHLLGLQVHDLGGQMAAATGEQLPQPADFPRLRLTRTLQANQVVTIEPGIYFIDSLLAGLRESPVAAQVNWDRISRLRQFGGIRIEDDVLVTESGSENLTRPWIGHLRAEHSTDYPPKKKRPGRARPFHTDCRKLLSLSLSLGLGFGLALGFGFGLGLGLGFGLGLGLGLGLGFGFGLGLVALGLRFLGSLGPIQQLHQGHGGRVTGTITNLQDSQIATRTVLETRAKLVKEFPHAVPIPQAIERTPALRHGIHLGHGDKRLDDPAQLLGLRHRGLNRLVLDQRCSHVPIHGAPMAAFSAESSACFLVMHDSLVS